MAPRVVLDTNCLISALIFPHGKTAELRHLWQAGRFIPLACRETVTELMRVLSYPKFRLSREDAEALLAEFLPWAESVPLAAPCEPVRSCVIPMTPFFCTWPRRPARITWYPATGTSWRPATFLAPYPS